MAKRKVKASAAKVNYLKPLPAKGWAIIAGVIILIGALIWWKDKKDVNQWEFVAKFGIKLPLRYAIHGIDVSHHNAKINWDKLKKTRSENVGIDFVYIKATEGATHLDRQFKRNWAEAKRVGMRRGAYHFYNPRVMSDRQVQNFIGQVRMEPGDLPPVLDLETHARKPDDIIIKGVKNWLQQIEAHYGVKPIIYVNEYFYKKYIAGNFDDYPLWLAGYSRTHLDDLAADAHVLFWQHSEKGWADGIRGFVDYNVFLHEPEEWADLANASP
ncbi:MULTISPECIES: glycoside hydrolase family 25 protein [Dyadobacter]|uniref:Glycoside hydrolase n=1 Tax=Dyadobacter chenhuakuii TaxID=2909339 RepID=A0ABY4XKI8_9BACT|nr:MULTISPECIES: GH25 family lysozyme [Dyadobacter]MCE7071281.1 glycoside hydrolase [Dyadobacter sp. CY327]MCF2493835.1 glycoside hydrolase [Dyadobacter chenhuakuii]MCF2518080.1 glycoside hydrolase [Dyadobacter sp. CY351]USJ30967.1 glycoside hydrolase [Dyadobacter chenhuakuii]